MASCASLTSDCSNCSDDAGDNSLIALVFERCVESAVWDEMERSFEDNAPHFRAVPAAEVGSYRLEWTELHAHFCRAFTQRIEAVLDGRDFEALLRSVTRRYRESDPEALAFMMILRTTLDFETWVSLSQSSEKRRYVRQIVRGYEAELQRKKKKKTTGFSK